MIIDLTGVWDYQPLAHTCIYEEGSIKEETDDLPVSGTMELPTNWELADVSNFAGKIEFKRVFEVDLEEVEEKLAFLRFEGVDYFAQVFLNGECIGDHEGYFQPFEFDVTERLKDGKNTLKVVVNSPKEDTEEVWPNKKKLIKGVLNHHDARPGGWDPNYGQDKNTGGIWNDVYIDIRPTNFIQDVKWNPTVLPDNRAKVNIASTIYSSEPGDYTLVIKVDGERYEQDISLAQGREEKNAIISFAEPKLWWTWDQGEPYLYTCEVELVKKEEIIHKEEFKAGIREVDYNPDNGEWTLNNRRIFLRGSNIIPTQWLSEYTQEKITEDIDLMKGANLNSIRVHAHVTRDEFYTACDEAGILVWQDFPLQWSYDSGDGFATEAVSQIKDMINEFYNHPSIGIWCCHNEPSVNTEELDPLLYNTVSSLESARYVHPSSDFREHPYPGWYITKKEEFMTTPCKPLVTEFGAQAMPNLPIAQEICGAEWPPDWENMMYHDFQYDETFNIAQIELGDSLEEFIDNSQNYQAELLKYAIENYRLEKYNNLGSIYHFMLVECWPSITWAVVDYNREPKAGYYTLQTVFQPVLVAAKLERERWIGGKEIELGLYAINDYHKEFNECNYKVSLEKNDSDEVISIKEGQVDIASDTVINFETFRYEVPDDIEAGDYKVKLKLFDQEGSCISKNDYQIEMAPQPPYKEAGGLVFDDNKSM
ncbi:beta-galactosidase/beta-glucuronidase [Halobacteroides halobius DSM 5150]|uniref:beta-mannosidase n=1 Tax=Halobacteroides halobius (strain ATCC 35273 / DSM 5150 / MD-1) TaxID=748449 RepID=L0K4Q0_HALHC|nr:sugar-binding domain-containing protein [Halobacteroides halobius]AGB40247.1 beta-galactosidase/beta-glucuronidase [Halobacteroides halobius DSM 5150]